MEKNKLQEVVQAPADRTRVTYQSAGQDVTLSYQLVRNFLTKGDGNVADTDIGQFISICKYNQLNPFLNEAYLVKFGNKPAQMIVSKEAYMKRAEACETYEGFQAGIIIQRGEEILELEGAFYLNTDKLLGGWAKVYRSDRKFPFTAKVRLAEYDKQQSTWKQIPSTMITKVAKVQALREAFPAQLGAMYIREEAESVIEDSGYEDVGREIDAKANQIAIDVTEIGKGGVPIGARSQLDLSMPPPMKMTPEAEAEAEIPYRIQDPTKKHLAPDSPAYNKEPMASVEPPPAKPMFMQ